MSLQVWLPLNGDLHNLGLRLNLNIIGTNITFSNNGKIGKCADFNGTSSRIYIPNFSIDNLWSYGCWVNTPTSDTRGWELVIILNNSGSDADSLLAFWIHLKENRIESLANTKYTSTIPYTPYYNSWHHFFATYNGTVLTSYIDGTVVKTLTITDEKYTGTNLTIGARCTAVNGSSFSSFFQGSLNDVRIYDHCLSTKEVEEIAKGLVLHYKLDNNGLGGENLFSWANNVTGITLNNYLNTGSFTQFTNSLLFDPSLTVGEKYTISFWAKSPNGTTSLLLYNSNGNPKYFYFSTTLTSNLSTEWQFFKYTVTNTQYNGSNTPSTNSSIWKRIEIYAPNKMGVIVKLIKVEKGEIATQWSPAKADIIYPNIIYDSSGYGNNGTVVGPLETITPSPRYNCATKFDGDSAAILTPNLTTMITDKNYTISCWTYKTSIGTKNYLTIYGGPSGFELEARSNSSTDPLFRIHNWGGGTTAYEFGKWYHFCFVHNDNESKLYINGELKITGTSAVIPSGNYFIGAWSTSTKLNYDGNISDFRIYATTLTVEQIKELYNTSMRIDGTNIVPRDLE